MHLATMTNATPLASKPFHPSRSFLTTATFRQNANTTMIRQHYHDHSTKSTDNQVGPEHDPSNGSLAFTLPQAADAESFMIVPKNSAS